MRVKTENDELKVHAIAGTHVVMIGLDVNGFSPNTVSSSSLTELMSKVGIGDGGSKADESLATGKPSQKCVQSNVSQESLSGTVQNGSRTPFLGFCIDRCDLATNESIKLSEKPIQKFLFGDYEAVPGREYLYTVRRFTNTTTASSKSNLVPYGSSLQFKITTENPNDGKHGIYFNRGVAGSRAYEEKFGDYRKFHLVEKYGTSQWKSIINPRSIPDLEKSKEALAWLSRGVEEALLQFLSQASSGEHQLRGAVYEFTHNETIQAFAQAVERGIDVKIIRHCKGTHRAKVRRNEVVKDEEGKIVKEWVPDETTESTRKAIEKVGFHSIENAHIWQHNTFIDRRHSSAIMHNKFIVLVKNGVAISVWTGSTNFTDSGIYGQSNVAHIVRDEEVAKKYLDYWNVLSTDPKGRSSRDNDVLVEEGTDSSCFLSPDRKKSNLVRHADDAMDEFTESQQPDLDGPITSTSVTVMFSPRKTTNMLQWYANRMELAKSSVHFTEAFSISQQIAQVLNRSSSTDVSSSNSSPNGLRRSPRIAKKNRPNASTGSAIKEKSLLRYILLDSKPSKHKSDKLRASAAKKGKEYVDYYDFKDVTLNRIAYGAILPNCKVDEMLEDQSTTSDQEGGNANGVVECGESLTGLTTFVDYIHTKYMIIDALTDSPTVITGSANFSEASMDRNDENMLIIHGDKSVADVYFTEFMRLFNHFYCRDKHVEAVNENKKPKREWGEIKDDESWLFPYFDTSTQLYKERMMLSRMCGA